ncbi:MAG: RHS repeat protein, partial [Clostridia bacterium]|nr:RHS repeat protein [Clostridia bacterium]
TTYDRTITWMVINGVEYYRYRDGDGTEHFFYSNGTNWVDEDGLGLTFDQTTFTITDLQDNKIVFYTGATANGRLKEIVDAQGNKVSVTQTAYGSTWCVTAVTDAAGRQTTYNRAADGTLQSITDPAGRATNLGYTGSKLTTITYPDNKTLVLAYDANGNLTTLDDADGVRRSLTYQSTTPYRVTQVSEAATNGSATGGYLNFAYSRNMTSVTDHLGKTTSYQFNNKGDCLCVIAPDGSAGFANYNDGGRLTHTASQVSNPQKFTANLLINHNAEQSSTWTFSAANGTAGYATDKKFLGNQSIKLYKTSATGQNSATQTVTLEKGKTYTLSAFVSTDSVGTGGLGAGLAAAYESSAGVFTPINGRSLRGTQDFIQENLTFTVPSNAYSGTVKLQTILDGTTGTAWFDCQQLETDKVANRYNIISNSDFDQTSSSLPVDWTRSATCGSSDIVINSASSGKPSNQSLNRMQLTGSMGAVKTVEQTLTLAGIAGDVYVFGAWGKGRSVPLTGSSLAKFAIELGFINGASEEWKTLSFNEDSSYWQYVSGAAKASAAYTSIKIRLNYSYNANTAEFDAIQLFKEAFGSDYSYDSNGNITQQKSSDGTSTSASYTSNNLTSLTLPNGQGYTYTYDSKHNPLTATSASGIGFAMTFDSYGNATSVKEGNDTTYIRNQASYSSNGNYLTGMTDPFDNVTSYSYNTTKGTLSNATLPNNQVTNYTYDANTDLLTGVSAVNDGVTYQNTYSYLNNSLLSGITHTAAGGNVSYSFEYNPLGWRTATKVGSQSLLSTTYEQSGGRYTGKVQKDVYGNGQEVSYDYDSDNRITGIRLNGTLRYEYAYDANSELSYVKDVRDGSIVWTVKDLAGRLSEVRSSDGS